MSNTQIHMNDSLMNKSKQMMNNNNNNNEQKVNLTYLKDDKHENKSVGKVNLIDEFVRI